MTAGAGSIEAQGLSVTVGSSTLLEPLDLRLKAGELTAIIGPNGAGKTSLVRALLGLTKHTGLVRFGDDQRDAMPGPARARVAAYLPQGQNHAWPLTVADIVALGRHPHGDEDSYDIAPLLHRMGLDQLADRSVLSLSGGEQMRVALARALAVEAQFLFADEPLASLDPHYQFAILDILSREASSGVGVIVVLHDLRHAAAYADRIIMMAGGRVVADGRPEEVLTPERVGTAFGVQTRLETITRGGQSRIEAALPSAAPPQEPSV
ncbi:MAG: ABC transporter ATP-binding protein [Pseudomonadota bacterium]